MTKRTRNLVAGAALATLLTSSAAGGTIIIADDYNAPNVNSGFILGEGLNSGINPPTTRLTGTVAENLRYYKFVGGRADSKFTVTDGKFDVARDGTAVSGIALSQDGFAPFDFSAGLGTLGASPANKSVYRVRVTMRNRYAGGTARFSFAISSTSGQTGAWDFGLQMYRADTSTDFYTLQKRIRPLAGSGLTADPNSAITTTAPGTWNTEIPFLFEITDAGYETTTFNSRLRISMDNGATWFYDTDTDPDLVDADPNDPAINKWRFGGSLGRFIVWDIASTTATYDDFSIEWISGPRPAGDFVWSGAGANENWSTGGNWVGGMSPSVGSSLTFSGTTRQGNINDLPGLIIPKLIFNNGGFTLFNATDDTPIILSGVVSNLAGINTLAGKVNWLTTGGKLWNIAEGSELVLNNNNSITVNGDHTVMGGGTLRLKQTMTIDTATPAMIVNDGQFIVDGGTFSSRGGFRVGALQATAVGTETIITNNGSFEQTVEGANFRVGDSANAQSRLVIDNSTFTMAPGSTLGVPWAASATGAVYQVGGNVTLGKLSFNEAGAGRGYYTNKGGMLAVYQIRDNVSSGGGSHIYFDNAILKALSGSSNAFMQGLNTCEILPGGLSLQPDTDVTIGQNIRGAGSLSLDSGYKVTLTGNNSYTGNTLVNAGHLILGTPRNYNVVQVADGASLGVLVRAQDAFVTVTNLSFASSGSLTFDLSTYGNSTNAMLKVSNLSAAGPVRMELIKDVLFGLHEGVVPLIDYDGTIGGGAANFLGTIQLPGGGAVTGTLEHNVAETRIDLRINGVPGLRWTGAANNIWDVVSQNWIDLQTGSPTTFFNGYPTHFRDDASTGNVVIDTFTFPNPSSIIVSNDTLPYTFTGGAIVGDGQSQILIRKIGPGSFQRVGGFTEDDVSEVELNDGSLIVEAETFDVLLTDDGVGTGILVKKGPGALLLNSANGSYDGSVRIEEGSIKLGHSGAMGNDNGLVTILPGTTLDLNDHQPGAKPILVSGHGTLGQGAIIDSTTGGAVETNLRDVELEGATTFGTAGRWDLRARASTGPGPGLRGNGHDLSKVGSGHVSIASQRNMGVDDIFWDMNLGNVFIKEGMLTFAENVNPSNPDKGIYIWENASLGTFGLAVTNPITRSVYATNATIASGGGGTDATNLFTGPIQLTGTVMFDINNSSRMIVNGPVVGNGILNVDGNAPDAMLQLNGVNTYPGLTTIPNLILAGGGSLAGSLDVQATATLAPGNPVGAFTVGGNATVAGKIVMELNRNLSPNSDRLVVNGTVNISGSMEVVLAANPQPGDVYQLFNKGVAIDPAKITLPNISGLPGSMTWDTTQLGVDGTLRVNGTAQPPVIGDVSQSNGTFTFSGTGGVEGATYYVVTSPDVAAPAATWAPVATNTFGPGGVFSFSTNIVGGDPEAFFRIKQP